ncbi:GcrA family cell cycle regulator [Microvirga sp. GCM10011540]|uniref:GcrA family cell cycle regulator n=1 Tax=Microvirga sp. GCM10011540 TaxID=3317338 RepID=UPI0036146802
MGIDKEQTSTGVLEPSSCHRTRLLKLGARQCRFIVGEDVRNAVCCGAPTEEGSSWCAWHRQLVYIPQPGKSHRLVRHVFESV